MSSTGATWLGTWTATESPPSSTATSAEPALATACSRTSSAAVISTSTTSSPPIAGARTATGACSTSTCSSWPGTRAARASNSTPTSGDGMHIGSISASATGSRAFTSSVYSKENLQMAELTPLERVRAYYRDLNSGDPERVARHFHPSANHFYTRLQPQRSAQEIGELTEQGVK